MRTVPSCMLGVGVLALFGLRHASGQNVTEAEAAVLAANHNAPTVCAVLRDLDPKQIMEQWTSCGLGNSHNMLHECQEVLQECKTTGPFVTQVDFLDIHLLQQLVIAVFSMTCNIGVLWFHWTHAPHPKFMMRIPRMISIRTHLTSGTIEILAGLFIWFLPQCHTLGRLQAVASFVHVATAFYQTPIVFGTQIFMVPAYLCVCFVKLAVAIKLFTGPCCVYTSLVLFNIHAIYAWCRIFIKAFIALKVFKENEYTIAIMFAGLICLPGVGAGVNMGAVVAIGIYIACAKKFLSPDAFLAQCSENHRNMFDSPMFHKGNSACPFGGSPDDTVHVDRHGAEHKHPTEQIRMLRVVFDELDTNKSGRVNVNEVKAAGSKYANSALIQILEIIAARYAKSEENLGAQGDSSGGRGFYFDELCDIVINNLSHSEIFKLQAEAATTERAKCEVIFQAIDKNNNGELSPLELAVLFRQYGLPNSEINLIMRKYDQDGNNRIDVDEFQARFRPLWIFCYGEMVQSFARVAEQESRMAAMGLGLASQHENDMGVEVTANPTDDDEPEWND